MRRRRRARKPPVPTISSDSISNCIARCYSVVVRSGLLALRARATSSWVLPRLALLAAPLLAAGPRWYRAGMGELSGQRALVTGASGGIGAEVARSLARRGAALVLCARRQELLHQLAAELCEEHGVTVDVIVADLSEPGAAKELWTKATASGAVDILINNAGFGHFRPFGDIALSRETEMLRLNIIALVELSHAFVDAHRDRSPE